MRDAQSGDGEAGHTDVRDLVGPGLLDLGGCEGQVELSTALLSDVESVLDQMAALLPPPVGTRMLGWHYRSRDERLIAPGVVADDTIRRLHVPGGQVGTGRRTPRPTKSGVVVDLVAEHARTRLEESLGVIAMGIKHANRLEDTLRRARQTTDVLD